MKIRLLLAAIILLAAFLRLYDLPHLPNGLHWDEQDTGYQAYSLLTTGKDYFGNSLPLFLHSFADYRTPVFIYSVVPFVKFLGLTSLAVRLPSAIYGILSVFFIYILTGLLFRNLSLGIRNFAAISMAASPWHVLYGRQSVECNAMLMFLLLGLVGFYKSFTRPSWLILSGLAFGLSIASYSPAKFFVPLLVLLLMLQNLKHLAQALRLSVLAAFALAIISGPILYDGFFGVSGTRFHDVSIFTDPTISASVNLKREDHAVSAGVQRQVGMQPSLIDKLLINKPVFIFNTFLSNYTRTFSLEYLFLKGDQQLRHSPSKDSIGQFHLIEIVPFLLGLFLLASSIKHPASRLLFFWLLVGPIPSALTRDGGPHAARTFLMLPAFILTISLGINYLFSKFKLLSLGYCLLFIISGLFIFDYFFSFYRFESAKPFQYGFDQVVNIAVNNSKSYDRVIVDLHEDSGLMAYLFNSRLAPAAFQSMHPLNQVEVVPGISGIAFSNMLFLSPGSRNWFDIFQNSSFHGNNLIISAADQPQLDRMTVISKIHYPDSTPAFYTFTK